MNIESPKDLQGSQLQQSKNKETPPQQSVAKETPLKERKNKTNSRSMSQSKDQKSLSNTFG
jgi:hypothetical protein